MPYPLISINSFKNYAAKLTAGTVTERASVQAIFDRVHQHLLNEYPNQDLIMTVTPLTIDTSIVGTRAVYKNISVTDEVYYLTDSKSPVGLRVYIFEKVTSPIRSIVLSLTREVAIELFGKISDETYYTLTTEHSLKNIVGTAEMLPLISAPTDGDVTTINTDWFMNDVNTHFTQHVVSDVNHNWFKLTGISHDQNNPGYQAILEQIDPIDYPKYGIIIPEPLKEITLNWDPSSQIVKTFTIDNTWNIITGATMNEIGEWNLTYRPCTLDEIPDNSVFQTTDEEIIEDHSSEDTAVATATVRNRSNKNR